MIIRYSRPERYVTYANIHYCEIINESNITETDMTSVNSDSHCYAPLITFNVIILNTTKGKAQIAQKGPWHIYIYVTCFAQVPQTIIECSFKRPHISAYL